MILAGTLGFAGGAQAAWSWTLGLPIVIIIAIWDAIGGGALGAALGHLDKRQQ